MAARAQGRGRSRLVSRYLHQALAHQLGQSEGGASVVKTDRTPIPEQQAQRPTLPPPFRVFRVFRGLPPFSANSPPAISRRPGTHRGADKA